MKFTGFAIDVNGNEYPISLSITNSRIAFNNLDGTHVYGIKTNVCTYRKGIDNSGQTFEILEYVGSIFMDHTIIGIHTYKYGGVFIQTWDRKEYFIDGRKEVKPVGRGKAAYYPYASSLQRVIVLMDEESSQRLSDLFDRYNKKG